MPERNSDGRPIEVIRSTSTRERIGPREMSGGFSNTPYAREEVKLPVTIYTPYTAGTGKSPFAGASTVPDGIQNGVVNYGPVYGQDNPFEIGADLILRMFGQGPVSDKSTSPLVVGDASVSSGGTSFLPIILIVVIAGIGYYLYKRYSG